MTKRKKSASTASRRNAHEARRSTSGSGRRKSAASSRAGAAARSPSFTLASECMISDAGALKSRLAKLVGETRPVRLEIGRLERIDTAAMQVLAVFVRDRERRGLAVEWRGTSATLSSAARLLGLATLLGLPA